MCFLVIIIYIIIIIYDLLPLYKQNLRIDFLVNAFLTLFSFTLAMLLCFGIKLPSPEAPIRDFITSIFGK